MRTIRLFQLTLLKADAPPSSCTGASLNAIQAVPDPTDARADSFTAYESHTPHILHDRTHGFHRSHRVPCRSLHGGITREASHGGPGRRGRKRSAGNAVPVPRERPRVTRDGTQASGAGGGDGGRGGVAACAGGSPPPAGGRLPGEGSPPQLPAAGGHRRGAAGRAGGARGGAPRPCRPGGPPTQSTPP